MTLPAETPGADRSGAWPVLRLRGITKRFGDLLANDGIDLDLLHGEVLALLGENGAGKTTLMSILFGHYVADAGTVEVAGLAGALQPLRPGSPQAALAAGIGMVHQHFALADNLSVFDNIVLGSQPLWRPALRRRAARAKLAALIQASGLAVPLDAMVSGLSVGERQRVEILKALYRDARILILDEPTAVLTPQEADGLFTVLRRLAGQGLGIVFISHKLAEVLAISRRVVVLRAGRVVAERPTAGADRAALAEAMIGRAVPETRKRPAAPGAPVLALDGVTLRGADGRPRLDGVSLELRGGEVIGIAGVSGNGQAALAGLVSGLARPDSGRVALFDHPAPVGSPAAMVAAGVGRIPEDRHRDGVVGDMAVWETLALEDYRDRAAQRWGLMRRGALRDRARRLIGAYDVRGPGPEARTRLLSGGNIQKLILGRVLERAPGLVLACQPTRGLDVGAVAEIHGRLLAARDRGAGVLLITEDLDEIFALSDRIAVIYRGRLTQPWPAEQLTIRALGLMMAGQEPELAHAS
ncbi:ABC transporter ATP-binding protein [Inquilinus sp. CA228]|uniref:ABC transporter ATP-binding protein n=1 Tax=Inquilinus sp. CA228 TaxID=3455609 RepID=UPI003F8D7138